MLTPARAGVCCFLAKMSLLRPQSTDYHIFARPKLPTRHRTLTVVVKVVPSISTHDSKNKSDGGRKRVGRRERSVGRGPRILTLWREKRLPETGNPESRVWETEGEEVINVAKIIKRRTRKSKRLEVKEARDNEAS